MASVILFDSTRMQAIEDGTVVSGLVDIYGHLILTRHDGSTDDAGLVKADNFIPADHSNAGVVRLATSAETIAGSDDTIAITPLELATLTSTVSRKGLVQLASSAETITGTDNSKAVTPADLNSKVASTTALGILELATDAQAITGTDTSKAVTPHALAAALSTALTTPNSRLTALEGGAWEPAIPSSISSTGSTATLDSTTGIITVPAGCTALQANGVFSTGYEYLIVSAEADSFTTFTDNMKIQFGTAGTIVTTTAYNLAGRWSQFDGTSGAYSSSGQAYIPIGSGYTAGGEVRRKLHLEHAAEASNTYLEQLWQYAPGAARETTGSGSFNGTNAFTDFKFSTTTGTFAGIVRVFRRLALV